MPRKKSDQTMRREKMLDIFRRLDSTGQVFALHYAEKLMELQELEEHVNKIKENRFNGKEACSFCGKAKENVGYLMAGGADVYICDECVKLCTELISEAKKDTDA